tara:strand:+ start:542 stop:649 length:108 start_codon:yes stop_codon:yes gene_type:complete
MPLIIPIYFHYAIVAIGVEATVANHVELVASSVTH